MLDDILEWVAVGGPAIIGILPMIPIDAPKKYPRTWKWSWLVLMFTLSAAIYWQQDRARDARHKDATSHTEEISGVQISFLARVSLARSS